jgi:hypothetical protein
MSKSAAIVQSALAKLTLTEKEKAVLTSFIPMLYAEPGFSDASAEDIAEETGFGMKSIGGILTSLQSKGIIWMSEPEYWMGKLEIPALIYLNSKHYDLHPCEYWQAEQTA